MHIPLLTPNYLYRAFPLNLTAKADSVVTWIFLGVALWATIGTLLDALRTAYPGMPGVHRKLTVIILTGTASCLLLISVGVLAIFATILGIVVGAIIIGCVFFVVREIPRWFKSGVAYLLRVWLILATPERNEERYQNGAA